MKIKDENIFRLLLDYEIQGSVRYRRFTTLLLVSVLGDAARMAPIFKDILRQADYIHIKQKSEIIILMRETDRAGALAAVRRALHYCPEAFDLRFSLASFPPDGVSVDDLMKTLERRGEEARQQRSWSVVTAD